MDRGKKDDTYLGFEPGKIIKMIITVSILCFVFGFACSSTQMGTQEQPAVQPMNGLQPTNASEKSKSEIINTESKNIVPDMECVSKSNRDTQEQKKIEHSQVQTTPNKNSRIVAYSNKDDFENELRIFYHKEIGEQNDWCQNLMLSTIESILFSFNGYKSDAEFNDIQSITLTELPQMISSQVNTDEQTKSVLTILRSQRDYMAIKNRIPELKHTKQNYCDFYTRDVLDSFEDVEKILRGVSSEIKQHTLGTLVGNRVRSITMKLHFLRTCSPDDTLQLKMEKTHMAICTNYSQIIHDLYFQVKPVRKRSRL